MKANCEKKRLWGVRYGKCVGLLVVVGIVSISVPNVVFATKQNSNAETGSLSYRPSAAVAHELRQATIRISTRRVHGVNSLNRRGVRRTMGSFRNIRSTPYHEQALDPSRIRVLDGATFAYDAETIRIEGLAASKGVSSRGGEARQQLEELLLQGQATMIPKRLDRAGNLVAEVYIDHRNIVGLLP